jgi:hypothetical protein
LAWGFSLRIAGEDESCKKERKKDALNFRSKMVHLAGLKRYLKQPAILGTIKTLYNPVIYRYTDKRKLKGFTKNTY